MVTGKCPFAPFVNISVLHGVVVNVVQSGEAVTLASHHSIGAAEPDLATLLVVIFVDLVLCASVKQALCFCERLDLGNLDEDVVVVR